MIMAARAVVQPDRIVAVSDSAAEEVLQACIESGMLHTRADHLRTPVNLILQLHELQRERAEWIRHRVPGDPELMGESRAMVSAREAVEHACSTDRPVLITGEAGTGKRYLSRYIHARTGRDGRWVELDGDASVSDFSEAIRQAQGGTLHIDRVEQLNITVQSTLLRRAPDVRLPRLMAATHLERGALLREGVLREDFYFAFQGHAVELVPLRDRPEDILGIARHFIRMQAAAEHTPEPHIGSAAAHWLREHTWPENLHGLRAAVQTAWACRAGDSLQLEHFTTTPLGLVPDRPRPLREINRDIIRHYLDKHDRNVVAVARMLGIGKSTLYRMLKNREL